MNESSEQRSVVWRTDVSEGVAVAIRRLVLAERERLHLETLALRRQRQRPARDTHQLCAAIRSAALHYSSIVRIECLEFVRRSPAPPRALCNSPSLSLTHTLTHSHSLSPYIYIYIYCIYTLSHTHATHSISLLHTASTSRRSACLRGFRALKRREEERSCYC